MPTVLKCQGYRFFFYSNEGNPIEPIHVHVTKGGAEAKVWLESQVSIDRCDGFNSKELRSIIEIVEANKRALMEAWREHFGN